MDVSGTIQFIASLAEVVVALFALLIAVKKKKGYGFFIAIAFGLLVAFNIVRIFGLEVAAVWDAMVFLIASLSMVWALWLVWRDQ